MIATPFLIPPGLMFETFGSVAPLGLQVWDVAAAAFAPDDLQVTATLLTNPSQTSIATPARKGVYGFARLPGLPAPVYAGLGDDAYWDGLTASDKRRYRVAISDPAQRFLPFSAEVDAPLRGLLAVTNATVAVKRPASALPLFSSTARTAPAGVASVRVQVNEAWRMVQASLGGTVIATGISDVNGEAHLLFPYPKLAIGIGLRQQTWPLQFLVWRNPSGVADAEGVPDMTRLLQAAQAVSIPGVTGPPDHTLTFGQPLTVIPKP